MILAIIERIENIKDEAPFNNRYYLTEHFKKIFDELDILLFPIVSSKNLEKVCNICDGLIVTGSCIDIPPHYYNENPIPNKNYDIDEFKYEEFSKVVYAATLQDSNDNYCPEMITDIDELAKYSKDKIEIVKELHREKAVEVLKTRGE